MDLDNLMQRFISLGNATVGHGPKHPDSPNIALHSEITEFFSTYPILAKDRGYVDFLEKYAGAAIDQPDEELTILIHGFHDFTENVLCPDEPLTDDDGYFQFAEVTTKTVAGSQDHKDMIGIGFSWDITGARKPGIYRVIIPWGADTKTLSYSWYCSSFLEWLNDIIEKQVKLF